MVSPLDGSVAVQPWFSEHCEKGGEEWGGKTDEGDPLERAASPPVSGYVGVLTNIWPGIKGDLPTHRCFTVLPPLPSSSRLQAFG